MSDINFNLYMPSNESCYPCDCLDSLIVLAKDLQARITRLEGALEKIKLSTEGGGFQMCGGINSIAKIALETK